MALTATTPETREALIRLAIRFVSRATQCKMRERCEKAEPKRTATLSAELLPNCKVPQRELWV